MLFNVKKVLQFGMIYKVLENRKYILLFEGVGGGKTKHSIKKKKNCTPLECVSIPINGWVVMRDTTGECDTKNGECFPIVSLLQLILVSQINLQHQCDLRAAPTLARKLLVSASRLLRGTHRSFLRRSYHHLQNKTPDILVLIFYI